MPVGRRVSDVNVRIHALVAGTTRLGPGYRAAIWFQGCPFRCPGCIAPATLDVDAGVTMNVPEVLRALDADDRIRGVTCTGGEPFFQPQALAAILRGLRKTQRDVIVFSGYTLEHLQDRGAAEPAIAEALEMTDVLIDGTYMSEHDSVPMQMRGSDNQRLHFLTSRYADDRTYFESYNRDMFEILPGLSGDTMLIGVPGRRASELWGFLAPTGPACGGSER